MGRHAALLSPRPSSRTSATPTAVEVLLLDWVSRELDSDGYYLAKLPQILGSFVAALCMIIGRANAAGALDQRALIAHLGLTSAPSSRVSTLRRAARLLRGTGS